MQEFAALNKIPRVAGPGVCGREFFFCSSLVWECCRFRDFFVTLQRF